MNAVKTSIGIEYQVFLGGWVVHHFFSEGLIISSNLAMGRSPYF